MRWVAVPDELSPVHLLEVRETAPAVRALLGEASERWLAGDQAGVLTLSEQALTLAHAGQDRQAAALVQIYQAEWLRQEQRWGPALERSAAALATLRLQISEVGRYNEAVATYQQGLLYYTLRSDEEAGRLLLTAQALFQLGEEYWGRQGDALRTSECRDAQRWLSRLVELLEPTAQLVPALIVPLYELENRTLIRAWAIAFSPVGKVSPAGVQPVSDLAPLPWPEGPPLLMQWPPDLRYAAFWARDWPQLHLECRPDDIVLVELETAPVNGAGPGSGAFVRRPDGRIVFQRLSQTKSRLQGVPRAILRREGVL